MPIEKGKGQVLQRSGMVAGQEAQEAVGPEVHVDPAVGSTMFVVWTVYEPTIVLYLPVAHAVVKWGLCWTRNVHVKSSFISVIKTFEPIVCISRTC